MGKFNLVIPAAGSATRLKPLSSNISKVMVRVNGKPCLDYIVEAVNGSVEEIVVVDGKFDDIREYCKIKHPKINFVKQPKLNGPRDAINLGIKKLKNLDMPLVVWLGDAIILEKDLNSRQLWGLNVNGFNRVSEFEVNTVIRYKSNQVMPIKFSLE